MIRNIAATAAGLVTAFVMIALIEKLGHIIYPPPPELDFTDMEAIRPYIASLPLLALLMPIFAYFLGAFSGTLLACYAGTARPIIFAAIIGLFVLAGTIANLIWIPHPHWFSVLAVVVVVAGAWLAMQLANAGRASSSD